MRKYLSHIANWLIEVNVRHVFLGLSLFLCSSLLAQITKKSSNVRGSKIYNPSPQHSTLSLSYSIQSPFAQHLSYQQYIKGTKVLFAGIKQHIRPDGSKITQSFLVDDEEYVPLGFSDEALFIDQKLVEVKPEKAVINGNEVLNYYNQSNELVYQKDLVKYERKDTSIFVKVFLVNPINSANVSYGGNYIDNNDQTNLSLDAELFWKRVPAKWDMDTFFLSSEFLYFEDLSIPVDTFFYAFNDSILYTRDIDAFEYLNVYYHLNMVGRYVNDLGYDVLTDTLVVDVHAFGGQDNSGYTPSNHSLQFGDGGIDDAEDGEVVVHEFVHSLSELASPNNTIGREREAMEEGSCDYFSKAYSRTYNDNTPNKIFTWDGNQTWSGFPINSNRTYPDDLVNSKDGDRDIWSSALMCMHDKIGRLACDSILLEHFFYQGPNTTMSSMAKIVLDIDSSDFGSRYHQEIQDCFVEAGFIAPASIDNSNLGYSLKIINQVGFVNGESPLSIRLPPSSKYCVYDMLGKPITDWTNGDIELFPVDYVSGMYVIHISINNELLAVKIIR